MPSRELNEGATIANLRFEIVELMKMRDKLQADAARYRWLRDKARTVDWTQHIEHADFRDAYDCHTRIGPQGMDAAIDDAIARG